MPYPFLHLQRGGTGLFRAVQARRERREHEQAERRRQRQTPDDGNREGLLQLS